MHCPQQVCNACSLYGLIIKSALGLCPVIKVKKDFCPDEQLA